jgi:hypothetical protein
MKISIENGNQATFTPVDIDGVKSLKQVIKDKNYSLGTFTNDHRTNENFEGAELIGLDFDGGFTLEQATEAFKDYWHIIGTTRSHQIAKNDSPACDRFRVILKAEQKIESAADYKATVKALMTDFPDADRACSDAARYFYPCTEIVCCNEEGRAQPVVKYIKPDTPLKVVAPYMKGELSKATLKFLSFGSESNWNHALFQAAVDLHEQQYTKEEATSALTGATRNYQGELDSEDLKTIDSAFNREPRHAPRKVESMFNFKKVKDMSTDVEALPWLTDGLMIRGGLGILAGPSKAGKSTITRQLAQAVANGSEWLGRKTEKGTVLYLALEEQEQMLAYQLKKLGVDEDEILYHVGPLAHGDLTDNLTQAINHHEASLVVVDTMILLSHFENLNDYNEVYNKLSIVRNIARKTNSHILLIHHTNKMGGLLGSTAIQGAVDCFMTFSEIPGTPRFRNIDSKQRGGRQFNSQRLEYIEEEDIYRTIDSPIETGGAF